MTSSATLLDTDMDFWGPGVRHYRLADGSFVAVSVDAGVTGETKGLIDETLAALDVPMLESGIHKIVVEPTVIVRCNAEGMAESLDRAAEFPPGTSYDDALAGFV